MSIIDKWTHATCKNCGEKFKKQKGLTDLCSLCQFEESEKQFQASMQQIDDEIASLDKEIADIDASITSEKILPIEVDGMKLSYSYEDVKIYMPNKDDFPFENFMPGDDVEFKKEPDNEYDSNAVAVYWKMQKIGYIYRGKMQDMINDYIYTRCPILSHISSVNDDEKTIKLFVAFYRL